MPTPAVDTAAPAGDQAADSAATLARRMTLIATSLGFAVVQLDISVVNVAIRSIGSALGGGVSSLQWVVSAYTVAFAAFILTAGAVGDRVGARRVFIAGFALFTVASVVCGLAPSLGLLVGARAVQGVGAAILVPGSLSLLNHTYPEPAARARAVGLYLAGASLSLSGGPLVGGVLIASLGWRAIFFINVPVAAVGVYLTRRYASETTRSADRGLDLPGQIAAAVTLVALVAATIEGGHSGFGDPVVLAGFAAAALAGAAFVAIEARAPSPMLPLGLFRSRAFSGCTVIGLLVNICFYGMIFVFSLLFQREQHLSPLQTGLALAPIMVAITGANLVAGRVLGRLGPRLTITIGSALAGCGCAALLGVGASTPYLAMIVQISLLGFGCGLIVPVITSEMLGSVDRSRSGVASGTLNTMRQAGSAIGVALFGSLIAASLVAGLHAALAISVGLVIAIAALTRVLDRRVPQP
jgi:DHA2 family methylenomycin A resistance protein-like MFS transporter